MIKNKQRIKLILSALILLVSFNAAIAWDNHALPSYIVLGAFKEIKDAPSVPVEKLEVFLKSEKDKIPLVLEDIDSWSKKNMPYYVETPDELKFKKDISDSELIVSFYKSIRINPNYKKAYYAQDIPGNLKKSKFLPWNAVTIYKEPFKLTEQYFYEVSPGTMLSPIEIISTASDEPDFGMDLLLWEDNGTDYGKEYKFGEQPFGDPKLEYSSQAPFHIGYYHESSIIFSMGSFLKRTYPRFRIYQFLQLSRLAFKTGHPYWGYRFLGWGLHYVQDLTQPYHSTVLPGVGTVKMLWINFIDMIGFHDSKISVIDRVSKRHQIIENHQYNVVKEILEKKEFKNAIISSLTDESADGNYGAWNDDYIINVLTKESHDYSEKLDEEIEKLGNVNGDVKLPSNHKLTEVVTELLLKFGIHTRIFIKAGIN